MKTLSMVLFFALVVPVCSLAQTPPLSVEDEIRAGEALVMSFQKAQAWAETPEIKAIEQYLQQVGDKLATHARRKLPYKFHLDPHPGFRSAVAYPGGQIIVGGGVLALMSHEDQLAVVLGHEIEHIDLNQCRERVIDSMRKNKITTAQFDKLSIEDFGAPYGKDGELAADREGIKLAVAAGYSPHAAVELLEVYQFLGRDTRPVSRPNAPSLEERIQQARDEIKRNGWQDLRKETPLTLP